MKTNDKSLRLAACRRLAIMALTFSVFSFCLVISNGPAWSLELDSPSSVINTGDNSLPIISTPSPVPAQADSCLPLLKSVSHYTPPASATDRNRRSAEKAAALGLVFGVRFALGPKEVTGKRKAGAKAQFDIWQPRDGGDMQAMAVAEYRRCKNEQALKAISDWRWSR